MNIHVVDKDALLAPSASIIGDVQVRRGTSIWYGFVLRGMIVVKILIIVFFSILVIIIIILLFLHFKYAVMKILIFIIN